MGVSSKTNMDNIKKQVLDALEKTLGVISPACKMVGISRQTFYNWLNDDADFKCKFDEINQFQIDFVESKLFENINNGDTPCTIFYLKTKGRERGYIERKEITGADGKKLFEVTIIDADK
jgi:hypothetical protein